MQELEKILEEINDLPIIYDMDDGNLLRYADVEEIISKHMNDGWIPCEERLPEKEGFYLVSLDTKRGKDEDKILRVWFDKRIGMFAGYWTKVIAWQPLPKPYRLEKGDNSGSEI